MAAPGSTKIRALEYRTFKLPIFWKQKLSYCQAKECWKRLYASLNRSLPKTTNNESITLAQLRDTLLPKLISGKLRIAEAEKFMERAGCHPTSQTGSVS